MEDVMLSQGLLVLCSNVWQLLTFVNSHTKCTAYKNYN